MTDFLQIVAKHYFSQLHRGGNSDNSCLEWADWTFIFPSRRAGMFFSKHLCSLNGDRPLLAPRCLTIGDLFGLFSNDRLADRTELLFRLYHTQNEVRRNRGDERVPETFEQFIFWGEMMLRDFDEVDKYLVQADSLFSNVKDLQEINSQFGDYDEETQKVIETFWASVKMDGVRSGSAKESFVQTWGTLYEIYSQFRQVLRKEGMAYEGMRQRDVVERLHFEDEETLLQDLPKHIVLVGITAINQAERQLLLWLKEKGILECCWDYADPQVQEISFIKDNLKDFGNALSDEECKAGIVPIGEKTLIRMAVPSGVGQAAEAGKLLSEWESEDSDVEDLHKAIILPDEHLLTPMLYNMPEDVPAYNVTMGYPLKATPVATLVDSLIFLQSNMRREVTRTTYYHKAVLQLLSHSFLLELFPDQCTMLRNRINQQSLYQVSLEDLLQKPAYERDKTQLGPQCEDFLRMIFREIHPIEYLRTILERFKMEFLPSQSDDEEEEEPLSDSHILVRECIISYLAVINKLEKELKSAKMLKMDYPSLFHLIQKLAVGESVSYSGEPMMGMQIMGVLETRAIDFDRLVILSMNEGIIPAKPVHNSFIPHSLRKAFGLPTQIYKDLVFAYHFYRLISRAHKVAFLYDCRVDGMQTGEQSRYLLQMQYLTDAKFEERMTSTRLVSSQDESVEVLKTPEVMKQLDLFRQGGYRNLSASNLKTYIDCPLQFYLAHVQHLSNDDEMEEEMDDSMFGTILHNTLKVFYSNLEGKMVQNDVLEQAVKDPQYILNIIKDQYRQQFHCDPVNGYQQFVCSMIESNVKSVLRHDMQLTPFFYLAGEETAEMNYQVSPDLTVRLKAVYDRLDVLHNADATNTLRIVDYKTGNPNNKVRVGEIDKIFASDSKCSKEAFQVLLYSLMIGYMSEEDLLRMKLHPINENNVYQHLSPHLYFTRSLIKDNEESKTQVIEDFEPHRSVVEQQMKELILKIFDPEQPFTQTEDQDHCKYCKFTDICNKNIKNDR